MIWQLAREQMRTQKRYLAWTLGLLAAVVALVTMAVVTAATQVTIDAKVATAIGTDKLWTADVFMAVNEEDTSEFEHATRAEVNSALEKAISNGSDVTASTWISAMLAGSYEMDNYYSAGPLAFAGDVDWDMLLASGEPPASGQIAVTAGYAEAVGIGIGDTATLESYYNESGDPLPTVDLEVSGILRTPVQDGAVRSSSPDVVVSWDDVPSLSRTLAADIDGYIYDALVSMSWTEGDPALDALPLTEAIDTSLDPTLRQDTAIFPSAASNNLYLYYVAGAVLVGTFALAFAVGRSQAQVRTQWVATARALGAPRRTIVASTLLESVVMGAIASAVGILLGILGAAAMLAYSASQVAEPLLVSTITVPGLELVLIGIVGVAMALIIGLVPAFWASRVEPAAALAPREDMSEVELSRRVRTRALGTAWVASTIGAIVMSWTRSDSSYAGLLRVLLLIVVVVAGIPLLREALRWAVGGIGRVLSRSTASWAVTCGSALAARPRLGANSAFILVLALAPVLTWVTWIHVASDLVEDAVSEPVPFAWALQVTGFYFGTDAATLIWMGGAALVVLLIVTLGVWAAGNRSAAGEGATHSALGLTASAQRLSASVQYAVPLIIGMVAAWLVSAVAWLIIAPTMTDYNDVPVQLGSIPELTGSAWTPITVVLVAVALLIAGGAALVAASTRTRSPLKQMQKV